MKGLATLAAGLLTLAATSTAEVVWLETSYNFGLMKEQAGPKQGYARFVNHGPESVTVTEARPTCGCTDASYPEDPVAPGDTAVIRFTYDPTGRPGRFDKSIKVRFEDGHRVAIRIRGNVLGTPESLAQLYPVDAGALRLSDGKILAGTMNAGKTPSMFLNAYNTLNDSLTVTVHSNEPAMKLKLSENRLGPGDVTTLAMYFDTQAYGKVGPVSFPITIVADSDGQNSQGYDIEFVGQVIPMRKALGAKELAKAPVCDPVPPVVELGTVSREPRRVELDILNSGRSMLEIQNVWSDSPAVKVNGFPSQVKKDKTGRISVTFTPSEAVRSPFRIAVKVASNDPVNPLMEINLVGTIGQ